MDRLLIGGIWRISKGVRSYVWEHSSVEGMCENIVEQKMRDSQATDQEGRIWKFDMCYGVDKIGC